jgi:hypothetical protein|tara:strand:+ start:138 stop:389 length:252 start_codon:yes stop_codon:yes gene_type:complete
MTVFELIEINKLTLHGDIEHFAELIRADEREACENVCKLLWKRKNIYHQTAWQLYGEQCAKAISARGQTKRTPRKNVLEEINT